MKTKENECCERKMSELFFFSLKKREGDLNLPFLRSIFVKINHSPLEKVQFLLLSYYESRRLKFREIIEIKILK
jgi:hypothetical protein